MTPWSRGCPGLSWTQHRQSRFAAKSGRLVDGQEACHSVTGWQLIHSGTYVMEQTRHPEEYVQPSNTLCSLLLEKDLLLDKDLF